MVRINPVKIGGVLYVVAVFQFFVFELVAETLYSGYSVANNYISDLGATCVNALSRVQCVVHQPSATIFDVTVFVLGLMLLVGAILIYYGTRKLLYLVPCVIADVAILLVGVFPENTGWVHAILSELAFFFTGVSLVLAWTVVKWEVIGYLSAAFGVLTLFFTVSNVPIGLVGVGGHERLLVLCALVGLLALGGYLTGRPSLHAATAGSGQDQNDESRRVRGHAP